MQAIGGLEKTAYPNEQGEWSVGCRSFTSFGPNLNWDNRIYMRRLESDAADPLKPVVMFDLIDPTPTVRVSTRAKPATHPATEAAAIWSRYRNGCLIGIGRFDDPDWGAIHCVENPQHARCSRYR